MEGWASTLPPFPSSIPSSLLTVSLPIADSDASRVWETCGTMLIADNFSSFYYTEFAGTLESVSIGCPEEV